MARADRNRGFFGRADIQRFNDFAGPSFLPATA
jgi:hypothetical protein